MKLQYAVAREDLTGLVEALRKLPKNHRVKLIIMGYSRLEKWIDWQAMKLGAPLAIVDPRGTSSECPQCESKIKENGYRILKCPRCGFEADRDIVGKLNTRRRALKILGISGGVLAPLTTPQMTDVNPNRWGEPMIRRQEGGSPRPFKAERRSALTSISSWWSSLGIAIWLIIVRHSSTPLQPRGGEIHSNNPFTDRLG